MPPTLAKHYTYTGNEVDVFLGGSKAFLLQTIVMSDDYGQQEVSGIGNIHTEEFVPSYARHNATVDRFCLRKDSMADVVLENGDDAMKGMEFDIEVFEKKTGSLLRKYIGSKMTSGRMTNAAHRVSITDSAFVARDAEGKMQSG
jgi:hypothetical protein